MVRMVQKRNTLEIYIGKASGLLRDSISRHVTVVDVSILLKMSRKHGCRQAFGHSSHKNALLGNMRRWGVAATIVTRGWIAPAAVLVVSARRTWSVRLTVPPDTVAQNGVVIFDGNRSHGRGS